MSTPALVWKFHEAPQNLQDLSTNGGDEDWLIELPPDYGDYYSWVSATDSCRDPLTFDHPTKDGWTIVIGTHA